MRDRARQRLTERWQNRWDNETKGRWTHELIPNVAAWYNRGHGQMGYYLTQALTGHGCFNAYLEKFKKTNSSQCFRCGDSLDDARHTVFQCPASEVGRTNLQAALGGTRLEETNLMQVMLGSEQAWSTVQASITKIMKDKEEAERAAEELIKKRADQLEPPVP